MGPQMMVPISCRTENVNTVGFSNILIQESQKQHAAQSTTAGDDICVFNNLLIDTAASSFMISYIIIPYEFQNTMTSLLYKETVARISWIQNYLRQFYQCVDLATDNQYLS